MGGSWKTAVRVGASAAVGIVYSSVYQLTVLSSEVISFLVASNFTGTGLPVLFISTTT